GRDGQLRLLGDAPRHVARVTLPATRVEKRERTARPGGVVRHPATGDAGQVLDHRFAAPEDAVAHWRPADVGTADAGDDRQRGRDGPAHAARSETDCRFWSSRIRICSAAFATVLRARGLPSTSTVNAGPKTTSSLVRSLGIVRPF